MLVFEFAAIDRLVFVPNKLPLERLLTVNENTSGVTVRLVTVTTRLVLTFGATKLGATAVRPISCGTVATVYVSVIFVKYLVAEGLSVTLVVPL